MPGLSAAFDYIDRNTPRFLDELFGLLRIPSVTIAPETCRDAALATANHLTALGFSAESVPWHGNPMVIAEHCGTATGPTTLLYGHYDVMPPGDDNEWQTPPFLPSVRGGRIYARGAADNKGQYFAHIKAIEALQATGTGFPPVKLIIEGEEESGSPHLRSFLNEHRHRLDAAFCFGADGARHDSERPTIFLGCRGVVAFELEVRGAFADEHSGNRGNVVPNPAWRLVQCLESLRDDEGDILIDGFLSDVAEPTVADRQLLQALPHDPNLLAQRLGVPSLNSMTAAEYYERLMFRPNLNINGLSAGHAGEGIKTIIPARAIAKLDFRLVAKQHPDKIVAQVKAHLKQRGFADVTLTVHNVMPPMRTPLDHPLVGPVHTAAFTASSSTPVILPVLGFSVPLYAFEEIFGIQCVWCAYANADDHEHAPNENLRIDHFIEGIRTTAALLARLADT